MKNTTFRIRPEGDPEHGLQPSNLTPLEAFTTGDKTELNNVFFRTDDESVISGTWKCAPCREVFDSYPVHEMITVLSGSVTMTNSDGEADTFTSGDVFFIARGTTCTWEITETLHKMYMIAA